MQQDSKRADVAATVGGKRPAAALLGALFIFTLSISASMAQVQQPPPANPPHASGVVRTGPPGNASVESRGEGPQRQNHLGDWLQRHQNMSFVDQENALRREPGFNRLAPDTQQRLVQRLQKLNSLPPEQRQRTLSRMEAMERLSPPQRDQVRTSAQQLGALPQERQRMVRKAFRDLRDIPAEQRGPILSSPHFQSQFSPGERTILGTLLKVEPYQGGHSRYPPNAVPAGR